MGFDFAKYVNEYLSTTKSAISDENTMRHENHHGRHVAKISSNPSKSKHLETATAKFFGMHIDFVNLRSETYNADSRIPTDVVSADVCLDQLASEKHNSLHLYVVV